MHLTIASGYDETGCQWHQSDLRELRKLRDASGKRFVCGVVLYDGEMISGFGDSM